MYPTSYNLDNFADFFQHISRIYYQRTIQNYVKYKKYIKKQYYTNNFLIHKNIGFSTFQDPKKLDPPPFPTVRTLQTTSTGMYVYF